MKTKTKHLLYIAYCVFVIISLIVLSTYYYPRISHCIASILFVSVCYWFIYKVVSAITQQD